MKPENHDRMNVTRTGFYSSFFLAIITLVTFGFAITAVPKSGAFCTGDCIQYPYLDSLSYYPQDYIWMPLAIVLIICYLIYTVSVHSFAGGNNKVFSRIGLSFAMLSSVILISCYFIQFSVVPVSLMNEETEGIALMTQYNPHGTFIALEELGYLMMSLSFLFISPVFAQHNRIEKFIRWIFILAFVFTVLSFAYITIKYGINREYRFEIIVISIDWLVLITNGILCGIVFKRALKQPIG